MLETKVTAVEAKGLLSTFDGRQKSPAEARRYDAGVLSVACTKTLKHSTGKAGVEVDDRGFIAWTNSCAPAVPHIFAIGDIVGQPMLAHKRSRATRCR